MSNELTTAPSDSGALMQIINRLATDEHFDVAKLEALLRVKREYEADEARKAFVAALNAFKADPPTVTKNKTVSYERTTYRHATLDNVCDVIGEALSRHGLAHRWEVAQVEGGIAVRVVVLPGGVMRFAFPHAF